MIIKCPECQNTFLTPDDLKENQKLQCGKCDYSWELENNIQEIPEEIKPEASNNKDKIKAESHKDPVFFQTLFIFVVIIGLLYLGARKYNQQIIEIWEPSAKIFELIKIEAPIKGEGLVFNNIKAKSQNNGIYLTGTITNTTNKILEVPSINISNKNYIKPRVDKLQPNQSTFFETTLPEDFEEIKVSF